MNRFFILSAVLLLMGVGCKPSVAKLPSYPDLRVTSPASGSVMSGSEASITGATNMPTVSLDGKTHLVTQGHFSITVPLHVGLNTFTLSTGNGYTTSTVPVSIVRSTSTTQ
ncbi:MAG: hypothetical protein ABIO72_01730 [Patescibacteria group bacterium]